MTRTILDRCLAAGNKISVHENGFLTIALPHEVDGRLHLWGHTTPWDRWQQMQGSRILNDLLIPCQRVGTPIHNHIFGMTSQVLGGRVFDTQWSVAKLAPEEDSLWGPYRTYSPDGEGKLRPLEFRPYTVYLRRHHRNQHEAGDMYNVPVSVLHQTEPAGPAATLMLRTRYAGFAGMAPHVMVPDYSEPDNEFRRDMFDQQILIALGRRILKEVLP